MPGFPPSPGFPFGLRLSFGLVGTPVGSGGAGAASGEGGSLGAEQRVPVVNQERVREEGREEQAPLQFLLP